MNTSVRARHDARGFSFIELLVTIIIAAIAFAAMVPLFVQAQEKTSADQTRNQALNVAQDRIEKVRGLPYDQITTTKLDSALGSTATLYSGTGSRTMNVTYSATTYPTGATGLTSQYKAVTVSVSWTPPPSPVKTVLLQTVIYRQYAGPTIVTLWTDPAMNEDGTLGNASLDRVTFSALPDVGWTNGNTKTVHFQVWDNGGTLINDRTVTYGVTATDSGVTNDAFWWNWDSSFAVDGTYKITATAANATYQGPATEFYFILNRGSVPGVPAGFSAIAGATQVSLNWSAASTATGYEVFRSTASSGPWTSIGTPTATSYPDTGLPANTTYWYTVRAINANGHGAKATPVSATTTQASSDITPPTVPLGVAAIGDSPSIGVIHLTWTASTDAGSGMNAYQIYRSSTGVAGSFTLLSRQLAGNPTLYNDTVGSAPTAKTYYYYIVAQDVALNISSPSGTVSGTVKAVSALYSLTLQNTQNGNKTRWAWVQCILGSTAPFYYLQGGTRQASAPAPVAVAAKNGTQTWSNLPPGTYNIWVSTSSTFPSNPQTTALITTANVTKTIN
jgi:prepilin-type N-terminal cleavage/methylation domain-containing protein